MGYCIYCDVYYKKLSAPNICRSCKGELCGTPPGLNSYMQQYDTHMRIRKEQCEREKKYVSESSLLDFSALAMINNMDMIRVLHMIMPEGHPPWYALLRAWYWTNKKKPKSLSAERKPKERLTKLLDIKFECCSNTLHVSQSIKDVAIK